MIHSVECEGVVALELRDVNVPSHNEHGRSCESVPRLLAQPFVAAHQSIIKNAAPKPKYKILIVPTGPLCK
jgi:hypothetical protein